MGINFKQLINIVDDVGAPLLRAAKGVKVTQFDDILTMKPFGKMVDAGLDVLEIGGKKRGVTLIEDLTGVTSKNAASNIIFKDFASFVKSFRTRLAEYRDIIPTPLYNQLDDAAANKNFALIKVFKDYYANLKDCQTLDDAVKLYPELKLTMTPREFIKEDIKKYIPLDIMQKASGIASDKRAAYLDEILEKAMSRDLKEHKVYPEVKKLLNELKSEILDGTFTPAPVKAEISQYSLGQVGTFPAILGTNSEDVVLQILKQNFSEFKPLADIKIKTDAGVFNATKFHNYPALGFPRVDIGVRTILRNAEKQANNFKSIAQFDRSTITSAVYTQSWKNSRLKSDLVNIAKKEGGIIQPIWQKIMYPETTIYPTDSLVDSYLVNLYKMGKRTAADVNPMSKYMQVPEMDKSKKILLQKLYKLKRQLNDDTHLINTKGFQEFKSQFDTKSMARDIEEMENHYKNYFFKMFWSPERRQRFSEALTKNYAQVNSNIELTDDILTEAFEAVMK